MNLLDLFLKDIPLVEEKHNGGCLKEPVVADTVEQMERLVHAVLKKKEKKDFNDFFDLFP